MKYLFILASIISLALTSISCKTSKESTAGSATENSGDFKTQPFRLILSFISRGAGTNSDQKTAVLAYIEAHPKKPLSKKVIWGREGEADYCFTLKELTKKEQTEFISHIKKLTEGGDLIIISENAVCQHNGR